MYLNECFDPFSGNIDSLYLAVCLTARRQILFQKRLKATRRKIAEKKSSEFG